MKEKVGKGGNCFFYFFGGGGGSLFTFVAAFLFFSFSSPGELAEREEKKGKGMKVISLHLPLLCPEERFSRQENRIISAAFLWNKMSFFCP